MAGEDFDIAKLLVSAGPAGLGAWTAGGGAGAGGAGDAGGADGAAGAPPASGALADACCNSAMSSARSGDAGALPAGGWAAANCCSISRRLTSDTRSEMSRLSACFICSLCWFAAFMSCGKACRIGPAKAPISASSTPKMKGCASAPLAKRLAAPAASDMDLAVDGAAPAPPRIDRSSVARTAARPSPPPDLSLPASAGGFLSRPSRIGAAILAMLESASSIDALLATTSAAVRDGTLRGNPNVAVRLMAARRLLTGGGSGRAIRPGISITREKAGDRCPGLLNVNNCANRAPSAKRLAGRATSLLERKRFPPFSFVAGGVAYVTSSIQSIPLLLRTLLPIFST